MLTYTTISFEGALVKNNCSLGNQFANAETLWGHITDYYNAELVSKVTTLVGNNSFKETMWRAFVLKFIKINPEFVQVRKVKVTCYFLFRQVVHCCLISCMDLKYPDTVMESQNMYYLFKRAWYKERYCFHRCLLFCSERGSVHHGLLKPPDHELLAQPAPRPSSVSFQQWEIALAWTRLFQLNKCESRSCIVYFPRRNCSLSCFRS